MRRSRKIALVLAILGIVGFGYSQYASASQIGVSITQSSLLDQDGQAASYKLQLRFDNPSLLYLTAGETEFTLSSGDERIGHGTLNPFVLPALSSTHADGTFQTYGEAADVQQAGEPLVKITGVTKYNVILTTIDVPFVFHPTHQQAMEFIRQS